MSGSYARYASSCGLKSKDGVAERAASDDSLVGDGAIRSDRFNVRAGELEPLSRYPGFHEALEKQRGKKAGPRADDKLP